MNLFGTHDTWAGRPYMRFHERPQVERLVDGLDIVVLERRRKTGRRSWVPSTGTCST